MIRVILAIMNTIQNTTEPKQDTITREEEIARLLFRLAEIFSEIAREKAASKSIADDVLKAMVVTTQN